MSNRVAIQSIEFKNLVTGDVDYGFTLSDDYESLYCNTLEAPVEDLHEIIRDIYKGVYGQQMENLLDHVEENEKGIYIGAAWFGYEEIEHLFEDV